MGAVSFMIAYLRVQVPNTAPPPFHSVANAASAAASAVRTASSIDQSAPQWMESLKLFDVHKLTCLSPRWGRMARAYPHVFRHITVKEKKLIDDAGLTRCIVLAQNNLRTLHLHGLPLVTSSAFAGLFTEQPHLSSLSITDCTAVVGRSFLRDSSLLDITARAVMKRECSLLLLDEQGARVVGDTTAIDGGTLLDFGGIRLDSLALYGCVMTPKDLILFEKCTKTIDVFTCQECEEVELTQAQGAGKTWPGHPDCPRTAIPACTDCAVTEFCGGCKKYFCTICIGGATGMDDMDFCEVR